MDSKQKIYSLLSQADGVISGETLSAELGVSRVSIWKHIQGLIHSGIPIVSSPKGYCMPPDPDALVPWAFEAWQDRIQYFQEIGSTMDEAMLMARKGCADFTVVVAQRQTCGRGRMQRTWLSADGGLYFTVVVRPDIPMMLAGLVNLAAAVDMANLLRSLYQVDACLKWPNDILVEQTKNLRRFVPDGSRRGSGGPHEYRYRPQCQQHPGNRSAHRHLPQGAAGSIRAAPGDPCRFPE